MTKSEKDQIKIELSERLASNYARRCHWVQEDDLRGEAFLAMTLGDRSYDSWKERHPQGEYRRYMYAAGRNWLKGFILSARSPASTKSVGEKKNLFGIQSVSFESEHGDKEELLNHGDAHVMAAKEPERYLQRRAASKQVAERLAVLMAQGLEREITFEVISGQREPQDFVRELGLKRRDVYQITYENRRVLKQDPVLRKIHKDLSD